MLYSRTIRSEHRLREQGVATMKNKAVVLLSGGLDSTTALAIAHHEGFELHTLSFDYGQRHQREVTAAEAVAKYYGVQQQRTVTDRKSTRLNSSHGYISYAVFCLKKKTSST